MCMPQAPEPPKAPPPVAPVAPMEAPKPMGMPDAAGSKRASAGLSQLRMSGRTGSM